MENYNSLSVTLSAEHMDSIRANFKSTNEIMPFLTGMTAAKKKSMPTMNVANKVFAEDCYRIRDYYKKCVS